MRCFSWAVAREFIEAFALPAPLPSKRSHVLGFNPTSCRSANSALGAFSVRHLLVNGLFCGRGTRSPSKITSGKPGQGPGRDQADTCGLGPPKRRPMVSVIKAR
ncbi:hypothetical protein LZ31DRAFT_323971 [Colletotrichum somersetense]|nr:hypothetical protein LZ31DRAFT_323971 [Colletotrichum somersetense]